VKVGELAKTTKISVRTLHHYDEIGLLKPSSRTDAGHRVYTESDISRLHRIISLKDVGFSLDEIFQFVGKSQESLREIIDRQLEKIEEEKEELERREWCLKSINEISFWEQYQGADTMLNMIREMTIQSQYFNAEERKILQERSRQIGSERSKEMHAKMASLTSQIKECMNNNISPEDTQVVALANEWNSLGKEGVGENPEIERKVKLMLKENPEMSSYRSIDESLLKYLKTSFDSQKVIN
jgi:DNA-binding transcriptional MerR regulator